MSSRRVVGIDLGSRRIGVAVSDALGLGAHPHSVIARRGGSRDLDAIRSVVREIDASRVVVGLPLDPEGREGRAARAARSFARRLGAALDLPVDLMDEQFSTVEAEEVLVGADLSRARRRQVVDKLAAAIILDRWMDGHR